MRKLNNHEKKKIKAGKGASGALFGGIANMIKAAGSFITDFVGTIATTVFMFTDKGHHDKASYKMGSNQITIDDQKSNELREKALSDQQKEILKHDLKDRDELIKQQQEPEYKLPHTQHEIKTYDYDLLEHNDAVLSHTENDYQSHDLYDFS
ncbi:hypothetical protein [Mesoplasma lactucae]|uniref:Uncharacterized protein n=1 Tax=Mesoplasma lactucae ATCC 49193 TaxID=81460 RepID=A0A291IRA1_9MOLU|nr:hypothetical protein [Mesoplasma lactucae]ATG97256.1 hypothetical protein CP520_00580 [Mesoplasma lactucae ATCC 49193]ATZ20296.1 hypothetical protein MLACT_v1c04750 [Mesoplasma lactucae ATCC 49193]MCL8216467.1 hypothetical protein [Mesoplasma lactucae ATCC 49193]